MVLILEDILVKDVMSKNFIVLKESDTLSLAIEKLLKFNMREVFVKDKDKKIKGIVTLADISKIKNSDLSEKLILKEFMTNKIITINKNNTLLQSRNIMLKNKIGRLPVIENGKLIGVIRRNEIIDYFYMEMEEFGKRVGHVVNNINEAICVTDKNGKVILWNKKAEKLYGLSSKEIIGKKIESFFPNAAVLKVLKSRKPIKNLYHTPKENYHVVVSALPIYINNEFAGVVTTDRDITEIKKLSYKLEKVTSKVRFLEDEIRKYSSNTFGQIIGKSAKLLKKIEIAMQVAKTEASVLITGESGTGKELFARAIHDHSGRKGLFVPVNCSAIPSELFESEFFGYEKGAFTGADKNGKTGILELANNGTIFLDEIGDMPLHMQAKLLRVLQEKKVRRVGGNKYIPINVRIISATNKDLNKLVEEEQFREDLYYRLNVVEIDLPPLRERNEDIILLIHYFIKEISKKHNKPIPQIDKEAIEILQTYKWKGNIRELKNVIEYLMVIDSEKIITKDMIPKYILEDIDMKEVKDNYPLDLNKAICKLEIDTIKKALSIANGNKKKAAEILNIPRSTLYYKMKTYGIECQ
ncbi:sigma-54 dependent transcriptional regulator PrdR [Thermohalobacter berrensis]|uniref:Sigma-54-dependent Fis family transcriptional regulator n=1 Tax=Thermohalobacter berrensis TaxID=99594 RepID=A0A419T8T5_9FIRM|nr:sigma-54 dependent transcriptional regulator PrdR [Thermohalobacter berrensis]RKD33796.1 sigma-54-dependent Fis family transcriptional regulator [Thermohalobacter berrensis]